MANEAVCDAVCDAGQGIGDTTGTEQMQPESTRSIKQVNGWQRTELAS